MEAIRVSNVTKRFEATVAVRDLSLVVPRGSVYGRAGERRAGLLVRDLDFSAYHVGLLMYGKRPTIRELARWIRMA